MNTKQLRQKILDLAIRGKLVPQDPNDEPASVLLEKIRAEKEKLIRERKIKRDKNDFSNSGSGMSHYQNVPFQVPEGWAWVRLGDICYDFQYGTSEKSEKEGKIAVLRMGNLQNGEIDYINLVYTSNDSDIEKYSLNKHDLLFNRTNSPEWVGKTAIYRGEIPSIFAGYIIRVTPILVNAIFINYLMNSDYHRLICAHSKTDGVNQSNINAQKLSNFLFPIPPLSEQKRIVSTIEYSFALIEQIESNRLSLEQLIKQTKSKVLDLAIRGKLVPQNPEDEPASALLERIMSEQKTKKATADIFPYPFEIPENWTWCNIERLSEKICAGGDRPDCFSPIKTENCTIPIYSNGIKDNGLYGYTNVATILQPSITISARGTIGFSCIRTTPFTPIVRLVSISPNLKKIDIKYLNFALNALIPEGEGSSIPQLTVPTIKPKLIPIPPRSEQRRIVTQIEKIFTQLDGVEKLLKS